MNLIKLTDRDTGTEHWIDPYDIERMNRLGDKDDPQGRTWVILNGKSGSLMVKEHPEEVLRLAKEVGC